eukprot:173267_1
MTYRPPNCVMVNDFNSLGAAGLCRQPVYQPALATHHQPVLPGAPQILTNVMSQLPVQGNMILNNGTVPINMQHGTIPLANLGVWGATNGLPLQEQNGALLNPWAPGMSIVPRKPEPLTLVQRNQLARLVAEANLLQSRHKFHDAVAVFNQVLHLDPANTTALNSKGVCYKMLGDNMKAMECYQQALEIKPSNWTAHNNRGVILKDSGLFSEAIECYKAAIQHGGDDCIAKMNMAVVLTDLGTTLKLAGSVNEALQKYTEALQFHPDYVAAYFNLGVILSESGRFADALRYYQVAVEKNPNYVEALCNIGVIYKNAGKVEEAIKYYQRALEANPNFEIANNNIAISYTDMGTMVKNNGDAEQGIKYYKQALVHNPKYPDAWYNLGVAYAEQRLVIDAVICYETAIAFRPKCAEAYNNLGVIYKERGNLPKAIQYYEKALQANPNFSHTLNNLGVIYTMMGKIEEAHQYCRRAIEVNPGYAEAYNNLGVLYRDEGRIPEAIKSYEDCLRIDPNSRNAGQNRLLAMNYLAGLDIHSVTEAHRDWGTRFVKQHKQFTSWPSELTTNRKLRIGFVSPDFFAHSVSYFIEAPLKYFNREQFDVFCYSNVSKEDDKTALLKKYGHHWRNVFGLDTDKVSEQIRSDRVDILVELACHTSGNRLDVMAQKPAPLQVTWIGYPNSSGLPTIDYRIGDYVADEPTCGQQFVEKLVRVPRPFTFLCYTPYLLAPDVAPTPAAINKFVTFGSFNNLAKVSGSVISLWSAIMGKVPHSRLVMKSKPFASETVQNSVLSSFERCGIERKRIDLLPLMASTKEHLRSYANIDISLDTFPYAGTTTTCESLYMGVPVVTLAGKCHAQNVGVSLLTAIGCSKLVARSEDQYLRTAVRLATTMDEDGELIDLKETRRNMRAKMLSSPLCDGASFTAMMEGVFRNMWQHWCDEQNDSSLRPPQQRREAAHSPRGNGIAPSANSGFTSGNGLAPSMNSGFASACQSGAPSSGLRSCKSEV